MDTSAIKVDHATTIKRMAREGKSIHEIRAKLDDVYGYDLIQAFMWQNDCITLQGAKKAISIRTRKLVKATREEVRHQIGAEIDDLVGYIYYAGKDTQQKLEKVRKRLADLKKITQD